MDALTPREEDFVERIMQGKGPREISRELNLCEASVKNRLGVIFRKLNVMSTHEMVAKAVGPDPYNPTGGILLWNPALVPEVKAKRKIEIPSFKTTAERVAWLKKNNVTNQGEVASGHDRKANDLQAGVTDDPGRPQSQEPGVSRWEHHRRRRFNAT